MTRTFAALLVALFAHPAFAAQFERPAGFVAVDASELSGPDARRFGAISGFLDGFVRSAGGPGSTVEATTLAPDADARATMAELAEAATAAGYRAAAVPTFVSQMLGPMQAQAFALKGDEDEVLLFVTRRESAPAFVHFVTLTPRPKD